MFYQPHLRVLFLTRISASISLPYLFILAMFFPDKASYLSQSREHEQKELWQPIDRDMAQRH